MPFFDILRLQGDRHCACAQKWCHFSFFPRAFKQKKIKALRPKMTKIASRGYCLKKIDINFAVELGLQANRIVKEDHQVYYATSYLGGNALLWFFPGCCREGSSLTGRLWRQHSTSRSDCWERTKITVSSFFHLPKTDTWTSATRILST